MLGFHPPSNVNRSVLTRRNPRRTIAKCSANNSRLGSNPPVPVATPKRTKPAALKLGWWLLGFLVLVVLGVWLANERSYARLEAYKQHLAAQGEELSLKDYKAALLPATANATPTFLAAAARLGPHRHSVGGFLRFVNPGRARVAWCCELLDYGREVNVWPEQFAYVNANRPVIEAIATALKFGELGLHQTNPMDELREMANSDLRVRASEALALAVLVDLRRGDAESALASWLAHSRLAKLRVASRSVMCEIPAQREVPYSALITWEALQFPGWSEAQLRQVQAEWEAWNTRAVWLATLNWERASLADQYEQLRDHPGVLDPRAMFKGYEWDPAASVSENLSQNWANLRHEVASKPAVIRWRLLDSYDDELFVQQQWQAALEATRANWGAGVIGPAQLRARTATSAPPPERFLGARRVSMFDDRPLAMTNIETIRRLTVTAIALHRHRAKRAVFPESLAALVPEFLPEVPRDLLGGQSLRYRLESAGQFLLWSVGEDLSDDGGDPNRPATYSAIRNTLQCFDGRDWVWPQPATKEEVAAYHAARAARRLLPAP